MGAILFLILVAVLVYAMAIRPKQVAGKIMVRLSAGDKVPDDFNYQNIAELLQSATWIKDQKEMTQRIADTENPFGSVEVICKGVTYRLVLSQDENNASKLTVSAVLKSGSGDIEHIRHLQEANRIRCFIMERVNPSFTDQPKEFYNAIRTMHLLRYGSISVMVAFACYAILPEILNRILGADVSSIYMLCAALVAGLYICFGIALPGYLEQTRSEELLDGVPVCESMDNEAIMQLLQEKLHTRALKSLYYDETGAVSIKGKCGTYHVMVSPEHPKLFVTTQGSKNARACQEAYYIRCAIMKLFDSAYPENTEKAYGLLSTVRRGRLLAYLSVLVFVVLIAVPILSNTYSSNGISNSYLSQYSDTVTVGEAFDQFFAEPNWESYKVGSQKYVDFRGGCTLWGEPATMVITFFLGNNDTFHVSNIMINGQDLLELSWPLILETIYSDAATEPKTAPPPEPDFNLGDTMPTGADSPYDAPAIPDENFDHTSTSDESEDTQFWGSYQMISDDPYLSAQLEIIYVSEDGQVYLSGTANYEDRTSEVYGQLEVLHSQYFHFEDANFDGYLNLYYDPDTCILTVEGDGVFDDSDISFVGTYAQTSGAIVP